MVDPDSVGTVECDSVASPDVLRVQVRDVNLGVSVRLGDERAHWTYVLDDNVAISTTNTQTLADDDTRSANTDNALVAANIDRGPSRVVVGAGNPGTTGSITGILNPGLACRRAARTLRGPVVTAALGGCRALGVAEVPGAVDHDDTRRAVCEPCLEPCRCQ